MSYAQQHLNEAKEIINHINIDAIEKVADLLATVKKDQGRIFFLGVGGSAGNCSHAVNDFRKIVEIESYAPTDNVSELTARTNDEGWATIFEPWLKLSKLNPKDAVFIFSVGLFVFMYFCLSFCIVCVIYFCLDLFMCFCLSVLYVVFIVLLCVM